MKWSVSERGGRLRQHGSCAVRPAERHTGRQRQALTWEARDVGVRRQHRIACRRTKLDAFIHSRHWQHSLGKAGDVGVRLQHCVQARHRRLVLVVPLQPLHLQGKRDSNKREAFSEGRLLCVLCPAPAAARAEKAGLSPPSGPALTLSELPPPPLWWQTGLKQARCKPSQTGLQEPSRSEARLEQAPCS